MKRILSAVAIAVAVIAQSVAAQQSGKWTGGLAGTSGMDDTPTVAYVLDAEAPVKGWLKTVRPSLIVRCKERKTVAYLDLEMAARSTYGQTDKTTVRIRWNDESPSQQMWSESTDNEAYFVPNAVSFIKKMATSDRLRIEVTPFNASPVVVDFNVSGFGDRLDVIRKHCRW